MSKRKNHDRSIQMRRWAQGSSIYFDGNDNNEFEYRTRAGLPMGREMLDYAINYPFTWNIELGLKVDFGGGDFDMWIEEMKTGQACKINELTQFVKDRHQIIALESPYLVIAHIWRATIVR